MAQFGVVRLVVSDAVRAERAERLYQRIESLYLEGETARRKALSGAFSSSKFGEPDAEQVRAAVSRASDISARTYEQYVGIQLELRKVLTHEEFMRLAEVR